MRSILKYRVVRFSIGVLVVLVTIELAMRLAGSAILFRQTFGDPDGEITIVTLGESTTADFPIYGLVAWPRVLAKKLAERGIKARVRNFARIGTTSDQLKTRLTDILDEQKPDLVISMMGVNDRNPRLKGMGVISEESWWADLRIVKLARAIAGVTREAEQESFDRFAPENSSETERIVEEIRVHPEAAVETVGAFVRDEEPLTRARHYAYFGYRAFAGGKVSPVHLETRLRLFAKAVESSIADSQVSEFASMVATRQGSIETCRYIAEKFLEEDFEPTQTTLENLLRCARTDSEVMRLKEKFAPKAEFTKEARFASNYRSMVEEGLRSGSCWIAMQYPLVPRTHLDEIFSVPPFEDVSGKKIFVVENETNFTREIEKRGYDELFIDSFAGKFGHTTQFGSDLIAAAAADAVMTALASKDCVDNRH